MTTDFETHPVGTARRLAELEGLAFARRRRTEYTCPVTDEDAAAARRAFYADGCPPWGNATPSIRAGWRRAAEAVRDRLSGREMHAEPTYHDGYETGRRDEAQAQAALAKRKPEPAEAPRPIDLADLRKGDRVRIVTEGTVKNIYAHRATIEPDSCAESWYLLDRPNPDAEPIEGVATAIAASLSGTEDSWRSEARAALAKIRETHTIEPRPTTGDLHA